MTRRSRRSRFLAKLSERVGLLAFSLVVPFPMAAQADGITESELKAAFIYNFAKFTEWPETRDELKLCMLDDDALAGALEKLDGKLLGAQHLTVVKLESSQQAGECQILYLGEAQRENLPRVLGLLHGGPTLTVSDATGFLEKGIMIEMSVNAMRIEFEVDAEAARRSGLDISGKLLMLAKRVY